MVTVARLARGASAALTLPAPSRASRNSVISDASHGEQISGTFLLPTENKVGFCINGTRGLKYA